MQESLRPQLHWITDKNGEVNLDFIGRFETLNDDFAYVCKQIGVSEIELPHKLDGGKANYREAYDSELREYVGKIYAEEIEMFGYRFENG